MVWQHLRSKLYEGILPADDGQESGAAGRCYSWHPRLMSFGVCQMQGGGGLASLSAGVASSHCGCCLLQTNAAGSQPAYRKLGRKRLETWQLPRYTFYEGFYLETMTGSPWRDDGIESLAEGPGEAL
jgi:hypothetical protein